MNKRRSNKKLVVNKETLRRLNESELDRMRGAAADLEIISWASDCLITCGPNSCLRVCTLNCSWLCLAEDVDTNAGR